MTFKRTIWIFLLVLMLTACRGEIDTESSVYQESPMGAFQREITPILEAAINKQFPNNENGDALAEQAVIYYEDEDENNPRIVFLAYNEDTKEMIEIRKELEEKFGKKVVFKKAKYKPKFLRDMATEISVYLFSIRNNKDINGAYWNAKEEVIVIEGKLSNDQMNALNNRFDPKLLKIKNNELHPAAF
ncbi:MULTISPECIES: hypothetical protein [unclassified Paenibacillus]|uniref:hypothetical protein n=1 Tax=unclassified Paenibacillus TaxID=185978 RepID=UPI0027877CCA|nr:MULTISPECIES: hypothetical protein [unclassified Paenibacillus]MDQ0896177.1 hypothetical protein [Paenibacillus sp. V4I7]MDQ0914007.1 hypothetical protein [Paenibacillus sp. V4I5]